MSHRLPLSLFALLASALPAQDDAALKAAYDGWNTKYKAFLDASLAARKSGELGKGGVPPENVQTAERAALAARDAIVAEFGKRDDLGAGSYLMLASMHERSRDYASAVRAYEQSLAKGDQAAPDLRTLGSLCIAAMNSKDEAVAAKWMKTTIAAEDAQGGGGRGNQQVRTSYYPRTLIALGEWDALDKHLATLAKDPSPACTAAAATFGVVSSIHRGDVDAARAQVAAIRKAPKEFPDHQAWAVLAELALLVHGGEFDAGAALVRAFLAAPGEGDSAQDKNQRRYLAAIEPFLGKPAPALRSDHCVNGELTGEDVLPKLRGKIVVLDFWQPWCEPCRKAMPEMVRAQSEHGSDVQVLGVCRVEDYGYDVSARKAVRPIAAKDYPAHVADFRQDMALNYPLVICDTRANSTAYRIAGVPTLVILDREGIVRYMSCGAGEPGLFGLALAGVLGKK